jgi:serralysin
LSGGNGNDTLIGGLGNDRLIGGDGVDHFVFNTAPNSTTNKDIITDFYHGTDVIDLSKAIFKGLGSTIGSLSSEAFYSGAGIIKSHDLDDRIIYNTTNGFLYYDADGTGKAAAIQIAILSNKPSDLSYSDFAIIG